LVKKGIRRALRAEALLQKGPKSVDRKERKEKRKKRRGEECYNNCHNETNK